MELEGGKQQSSVTRAGERHSTSSLVGTPKFSPKLELTKIAVGPLVKRPQRMVGCKSVVEYEKAGGPEQSMERHLPMFVSCQLTESLQRSITKVKRRREQEGSLKDKTKHLNQKKLVHPRRRRLQCPASAACICIAIDPAVESSDVHEFARMGGVMEEELEIQQDAIIQPLQPSKKKTSSASRTNFLEESDEETEPEVEPQHLNPLPSQTRTPDSSVLHQEGATSHVPSRVDDDQDEVCKSPHRERKELSSEGIESVAEPEEVLEGVEETGSLSIISESQIDIQTEMDVLTTSADVENGKISPAPEPVSGTMLETALGMDSGTDGPSQTANARWSIDPNLVVVNNDVFDTVVDQLSLSDQENEDDNMKEETMVASSSTPGTEGQHHNLVAPTKTKMKFLMRRSPRKYAPTKRLSKSDDTPSGGGRRRKKQSESDKQSGSGCKRKPSLSDKDDVSKHTRRKKKEVKEQPISPPEQSSVESSSEPNETSTPSKRVHKADAVKKRKIGQSVTTEETKSVEKKPKGRPRKGNPDMEDPSSGKSDPKVSPAVSEKKANGRPRKLKHEENKLPTDDSEDEAMAVSEKKAKGRSRKKKHENKLPTDGSEDEVLAVNEKKAKGRPRKKKHENKLPTDGSEDEALAVNEKKAKGRPRKKKHENKLPTDGSEDEALAVSEKKAKGRPRGKKHESKLPADCSEDEALAVSEKKAKGRSKKKYVETEPANDCSEPLAIIEKKPKRKSRKHKQKKEEPTDCSEDEAVAIDVKKPKGRPKKRDCSEPLTIKEKKTTGRCRNNKGEEDQPSNGCGESVTTGEKKAKVRPRKRKCEEELPNDSGEPVAKKSRRTRKSKDEDKSLSESSESKLSPAFLDQVSEDSGYPSSNTNSRSPTDCVLLSPINNPAFLQEDSFQESSNPILRDSNFGISKPETDTGSDIDTSQGLDASQGEAEVEYSSLLHGMQPGFGENIGEDPVPSATSNVLYELDLLLSQDPTIFNFDRDPDLKLESSSEVDEILQSPSVSNCIRGLQLSGALPRGDSPQPDQDSHTGLPQDSIETTTPVAIPPSNESSWLVSGSHTAGCSSENDQLGSDARVSGDSNPACGDSNCTQKGAVVNSSQRRRKPILPILPPSMQTKSGRRLKRSWKLCSDLDTDLEMALRLSAEDTCKIAASEKSVPATKGGSNGNECEHNLHWLHPELSSANAPLSALAGATCEQVIDNIPAKGGSPNSMEKPVAGLPIFPNQEIQEPKNGNPLTGNTLRNKVGEKGTNQCEIISRVKPELKAPLRKVKVKLKRSTIKALGLSSSPSHGSGGFKPDGDGHSPCRAPLTVGDGVKEPLPGTSTVNSSLKRSVGRNEEEQSTTTKELSYTTAVVPHTSVGEESERGDTLSRKEVKDIICAGDSNTHRVSTPNGIIPSDKELSLFSQQKSSDGGASGDGIFSGRVGSIFAGSHLSRTVSSSGSYTMPHIANAETVNLKSQSNSSSSEGLHSSVIPSASYKQNSSLPHSNSLSMSLDMVLKQMGEVKDNSSIVSTSNKKKTCRVSEFKFSISDSKKTPKLPQISDVDTASKFEKDEAALGRIQYNSPSAYKASLASSAISDLILTPLNVGETLDEELKGESLFDSDNYQAAESLLATCKEVQDGVTHTEIEKDASQLAFDERAEACYSKDKQPDVSPPDLDSEVSPLHESEDRIEAANPFKEPKSPPVIRRFHLSSMEEEDDELMDEDCISLFPREDDDLLGGVIDEEPLAKFYAKCPKVTKSTGAGMASPSPIKRKSSESRRGYSPPPLDDGGFESSFEKIPVVVPFKSQQVSRWVTDQQKRMKVSSQASRYSRVPLIHLTLRGGGSPNPWGSSSGGNSHGVPHGNTAHVQENGSASPGPFVATNLPQGHSNSSQESDSCSTPVSGWPTGPVANRQYCKYFLLQRGCPLRACRFLHCPRERAPPHIVEEMVFRQPVEKISVEELRPYVANHHSYCTLKNNFASFVDIMKSLLEKRFATTVSNVVDLITLNGVKFSTAFLCRLMEKCAVQTSGVAPSASSSSNMTSVAETLLSAIEESRGGQLIPEDYHFYINTLINSKATQQLSMAYRAMKARHICPSTNTLFVLLRFVKSLDESIFPQLLDDVRRCQFNSVEKASYVSRLVECVDPQLVETHSAALGKWLAETSRDITVKLSSRCCEHLYTIFTKKGQWNYVVELFASCSRYVHELGPKVREPLATALQHLGPSDKLIDIAETLTEDQMARMSSGFWDMVLQECAKKGKSQRISVVYTALYRQKNQLSKETVSALTRMYLHQHNHSAAISLFMESLQHGYSLGRPDQLLISVCEAMEKTKATYNLYTVVKMMMEYGISPPAAVLQSMLNLCIAEKQFIKLADVIKLAVGKGLLLERAFCQKALVELRHWGRDPDAISAAYKSLRKLSEGSEDAMPAITTPSTSTRVNHTLKKTISICRRSSLNIPVGCPSPPPPPPPPQPPRRSISLTAEGQHSSTHESMLDLSSPDCEKPEILNLIEENGCRGQFGAVASVLTTLPNSTRRYSRNAVYSVWKGLVSTDQRAANCFSTLLESLDQYRAAKSHSVSDQRKLGSSLLPSDRWLISQVGIALLKGCDQHQDWQSGFLLLHNLHLHGIHYVKLSQPSSSLPPFMPRPPSPCEVALLAVKMCLKMKQVTGALEVLHGCEWIKAANDEEVIKRTETLCSLAEKCLAAKMLQEAWKCLDNIDCGEKIVAGSANMITNLHNKLLQNVLSLKETGFALTIYRKMQHYKLQCLPTVFSALLQHLCDRKQVKLAKDLCKAAISEKAYCPLVHNDLFKVVLTPGLVGVELHLLIEDHLRRLADEVNIDSMRPLSIQFCPGSRHPLEQVLSQFIKPALQATFTSSNCATISAASLQQWCNVNYWNRSISGGEEQSTPTVVGQKRHFSEIGGSGTCNDKMSNDDIPVPGLEHGSGSEPRTGMEPGLTAGPNTVPRLGHGLMCEPALTPGATSVSTESTEAVMQEITSGDLIHQRQGKGDTWKDFKRAVCNAVMSKIKPYYKEKFKSEDDYLHFFRVLTQNCSKLYKSTNISDCYHVQSVCGREELVLTDSVLQRISMLVTDIMSKCQVYSRELDEELGLTSGFNSD